ncbi:galactosyltransferase-related protein [Phytobacter sp. V91]|uniref:galactosyltransferase-related protein n=1 Tax=Phytobacter sp. V91 TaxID=3369425 RepID=UPI003F5D7A4C
MNDIFQHELSVIIPIDLRYRAKNIIEKAMQFSSHAFDNNVNVIFGIDPGNIKANAIFLRKLGGYKNVEVVFSYKKSIGVNSSLLRNVAFDKCKTKYVAFFDVDIYPDFNIILKYLDMLKNGVKPFFILPCLYLTKSASNALMKSRISSEFLKNRYFSFSRKEFLHLASPSSLTIMHSSDFVALHGFDTYYEGHGYEDFDFLIRLCELHGLLVNTQDLLIDKTSRSPLFSVGFRKHLGLLCIESLVKKDIFFHLFHEKNNEFEYSLSRRRNKTYFMSKFHDYGIENPVEIFLLSHFIEYCSCKGLDLRDYSVLFENKPGHIDRYDTLKRKLRFLLK